MLLKAQAIGSFTITAATFVVSLVLMYAVHMIGLLRVSGEGEAYGLDLHEHGINAYPEYLIHSGVPQTGIRPEKSGGLTVEPAARAISEPAS